MGNKQNSSFTFYQANDTNSLLSYAEGIIHILVLSTSFSKICGKLVLNCSSGG